MFHNDLKISITDLLTPTEEIWAVSVLKIKISVVEAINMIPNETIKSLKNQLFINISLVN